MERRLILAIVLSLLILLSWSAIISRVYHLENKGVTVKSAAFAPPQIIQEQAPQVKLPDQEALPTFSFEQDKIRVEFIESQAAIKEIFFKDYPKDKLVLGDGFAINDSSLSFKKVGSSVNSIIFQYSDNNKKITKEFIFSNSGYELWLGINVQNDSAAPLQINLPLWLGSLDFSPGNRYTQFQDVAVQTKEKMLHIAARKNQEFAELQFMGLRNRYFCVIAQPEKINATGLLRKVNGNILQVGLSPEVTTLLPGKQIVEKFHIYLGLQNLHLINSIHPEWSAIIYYGTFDIISQTLLQALEFIYHLVRNWGLAIILLSLLVYLLLFPFTLKQMRSMKEMQLLQPKIEELN